MKKIDLQTWKRKEHFEFFYRMDYPQYNICANIDITHFLKYVKDQNLSFYYAMIYAVTRTANLCENFRYRVRENKEIVLHEKLNPSFTDMNADQSDDLFKLVTVESYLRNLEVLQNNHPHEPRRQKDDRLVPKMVKEPSHRL